MLDPPGNLDDIIVIADWVELSVLTADPPEIDRMSVGETLDAAGLMGMQDGGLPPGDLNWLDDDAFNPEDESDRYTELVWGELQRRSEELGIGYPFAVSGDGLAGPEGGWKSCPAYLFLLLADHGQCYAGVKVALVADSLQARLFEKIVEASAKGLFGGVSQRFGWPREPGWPTSIVERIETFASLVGLEVEGNLPGKTTPHDKDRGLDVAASLGLGVNGDASAWLLFQCAGGENWNGKRGEPSLTAWQDVIAWRGQLLKGIALPWRIKPPWDINRVGREFEGVVLERERLVLGNPDSALEPAVALELLSWCRPIVEALPYLAPVGP